MKLLVTGAAGFIGSRFCEMALGGGHSVRGVDSITYAGRTHNLDDAWQNKFYLHRYSICDADAMRSIFEEFCPDAVVHLAAETHVTRSIDSREAFLQTNVIGTNVLLEVALEYWNGIIKSQNLSEHALEETCRSMRFRFLHVSTDEVYGSLGPYEEPWTEASPYAPKNPYSASKAASDHLALAFHNTYDLPVIVTHAANNYGSRQHPEKLIPTLIRQCMNGEPMTLHGDGQQKRDWLHVDDHCRGLLAALHGNVGETYNFGGDCERTNLEIANLVSGQMLDTCVGYINIADRPGNDRRYAMNISKAFDALCWMPRYTIEESIAEVVQWYLNNPNYGDQYGR